MFAKLLSVLSVRYVLRPQSHVLHYDEQPNDALEWQCVCRLATCVKARCLGLGLADPNPNPKPNPNPRHLRQGALVRARAS